MNISQLTSLIPGELVSKIKHGAEITLDDSRKMVLKVLKADTFQAVVSEPGATQTLLSGPHTFINTIRFERCGWPLDKWFKITKATIQSIRSCAVGGKELERDMAFENAAILLKKGLLKIKP